ncbi:hypothetical protein KIPB_004199 [Kipferlia bialata]|uniref:PSI domain-containing protein n=1 Tax=Kipferlia bialata TaxID=797122 RepID=A0A9K3GGD5_9EUKA|nr:hypothetical protein KIPB_004199 [Kipferlia bialata]|eukprot:g4199.t1
MACTVLNDMWRLDWGATPEAWTRLDTPNAPPARAHASGILDGDFLYVFGGQNQDSEYLDDLWVYCISTNTWAEVPANPMSWPSARAYAAMALELDQAGHAFLFGGKGPQGVSNEMWQLYLMGATSVFRQLFHTGSDAPSPRHSAAFTVLPTHTSAADPDYLEDCFYVYGGLDVNGYDLGDTWRMRSTLLQWELVDTRGVSPGSRSGVVGIPLSLDGTTSMLVTGGPNLDVLVFHPDSETWARWSTGVQTTLYYATAYAVNNFVHVFGGCGAAGYSEAVSHLRVYWLDECAVHVPCGECAAADTCGFCSQTGNCMTLDADGVSPSDGVCTADLFRTEEAQCPLCESYTLCGECVNDPNCGYCAVDKRCQESAGGVPLYGKECLFFEAEDCSSCSGHNQYGPEACVADPLCGWCAGAAVPTCMEGSATWSECPAGWEYDSVPDCDQYTTCGECASLPTHPNQCGWCQGANEGLGACISGSINTPWEECPSQYTGGYCVDCTEYTTCDTCTVTSYTDICGWCASTGECVSGDGFGPLLGFCPDWRSPGDVCYTAIERCRDQSTYASCTSTDDCGWCGDEKDTEQGGLCYFGGKEMCCFGGKEVPPV